jgi:hypothetical protein
MAATMDTLPLVACIDNDLEVTSKKIFSTQEESIIINMKEEALLGDARAMVKASASAIVKRKTTYNVTRTQTSSPLRSIKKQQEMLKAEGEGATAIGGEFRNDYRESVIENKNDYWRRMCWCEIQKKRKSRSTVVAIDLRSRFERYDRWERKDFRSVNWKAFYDEMRREKTSKPDEWLGDPRFLAAIFVIMFAIFYVLIASL